MADFPVVSATSLDYDTFLAKFMSSSTPCMITDFEPSGDAFEDWTDADGTPNWVFLTERFGDAEVSVTFTTQTNRVSECDDVHCETMTLGAFVRQFVRGERPDETGNAAYVKDWHFVRDFQHVYPHSYRVPEYFTDDWLNWWWALKNKSADTGCDFAEIVAEAVKQNGHGASTSTASAADRQQHNDYKFVYVGTKGSFTPMHHDVFMSNSWSMNVCGIKEWVFVSPDQAHLLEDALGNTIHNLLEPYDESRFPNVGQVKYTRMLQPANALMFVPSGWRHQVRNVRDTISINHNWFNGHNLSQVCEYLLHEVKRTRDAIRDCRTETNPAELDEEWERLCQTVFKANCGIDIPEFAHLIEARLAWLDTWRPDDVASRQAAQDQLAALHADAGLLAVLSPLLNT